MMDDCPQWQRMPESSSCDLDVLLNVAVTIGMGMIRLPDTHIAAGLDHATASPMRIEWAAGTVAGNVWARLALDVPQCRIRLGGDRRLLTTAALTQPRGNWNKRPRLSLSSAYC
jgi:hypothetical protein